MIFIQLTGLSGAGKTTLANNVKTELQKRGLKVEVIDGDEYRKVLCKDLGFSKEDRCENIRRLGFVGVTLARQDVIVLMAAINPYDEIRRELEAQSELVKTVWIRCDLETLKARDTKGLYKRAFLPDDDPQKLTNLTGVNDPFEEPSAADLIIETDRESESESSRRLLEFITSSINARRSSVSRALFIGRWQPFHNGHRWLIDQKLRRGIPVLIAVRDVKPDASNPLTTGQTVEILEKMYAGEDVQIIIIPDIESVNFGRKVGYEINEFAPPADIGTISATEIRSSIRRGSEDWKQNVDAKIHDLILRYLS